MVTSVKVDESTKDRLEQLQATIKLETGRKVTQQELLDRIVAGAYETRADLVDSYRDDWEGLSATAVDSWLSETAASGDPVDERDIDRVVYGHEVTDDRADR